MVFRAGKSCFSSEEVLDILLRPEELDDDLQETFYPGSDDNLGLDETYER